MPPTKRHLHFGLTPTDRTRHSFMAWNVDEAKKIAKEYLRTIVLPTDRPGRSLGWAFLELPEGKKLWLVREPKEAGD